MPAIRAVLFDLDGTLYDRDAAMSAVAHDQFAVFRDRLQHVEETRFAGRLLDLDDHGYARRTDLYQRLAIELGLDETLAADLESSFRNSYMRRCEVADDTWTTLRALRSAGQKLGVITNGPTNWQMAKLEALGMADVFDVVLVSETEGVSKPDPRIFARALERIGVAADMAMFVGDHPEIDVAGARDAGLVPVWKRVPYWTLTLDDVLVVDRLSEILPITR